MAILPRTKTLKLAPLRRHGGSSVVTQAVIDLLVGRAHELDDSDRVEITQPEHGAYLPEIPATVVVIGGSVCLTVADSSGRFEVRDGVRIAHGHARVDVVGAEADLYDQARAVLGAGGRAYLYSGSVHAHRGSSVYAWAGMVRADAGSRVWLMGRDVDVAAESGAIIEDGECSSLAQQAAQPLDHDVFETCRRAVEEVPVDP